MKILQIIAILLVASIGCSAQANGLEKVDSKIETIVNKIAEEDTYKSSAVGIAGVEPEQWKRYRELKKLATDKELILLTDHSNGVVRTYSFQALADRKHPKTYEILKKHLKDNQRIGTYIGCIIGGKTVGDFFLEIANPQYVYDNIYKLTDQQITEIENILLHDPEVKLHARSILLESLEPIESNYKRVREIFDLENSPHALIALSKYNKKSDIEPIRSWLTKKVAKDQYYGLKAVRYFPAPDLFSNLETIHQQEIIKPTGFNYSKIRMLYLAIVQYRTPESRQLLEETVTKVKGATLKYHSKYIWLALMKYPAPIYDGLMGKIVLSESEKKQLQYKVDQAD